MELSNQQQAIRTENHPHSSRSKAHGASAARNADITRGDLVFIKSEGDKNKSRDMYLVMDIQDTMAVLQKLNGTKFQSTRYDVPLTNIYHAIKPNRQNKSPEPITTDHTSVTSSSSSDEDDENEEDIPPPPLPRPSSSSHTPPRRSTRIRNPPQRYGEWALNANVCTSSESS